MEVAIMLSKNMHWIAYYGGFDVTHHVLSEILRAGRIDLENVRVLHMVAHEQGNAVFCRLLDWYNSGNFERINQGCFALTGHILQGALSSSPNFRFDRAKTHGPNYLNYYPGFCKPPSPSVLARSFYACLSSHWPRKMVLSRPGVLHILACRLVCLFISDSNLSCESRFYSAILRRALNVTFARKIFKHNCLQNLNTEPPSRRSNQQKMKRACVVL
jgi:hypothetical protein